MIERTAMLIVDDHEDLAMNAIAEGRDYLRSAHAIRIAEHMTPGADSDRRLMQPYRGRK